MLENNSDLIRVSREKNSEFRYLFDEFTYFENYINFAFDYSEPEVWVNRLEEPTAAYFFNSPAYFFVGDPESVDQSRTFAKIPDRGWLLASNERWNEKIKSYFTGRLEMHARTQFSSHKLDINHIRQMKRDLPEGIDVVKINSDHIRQEAGILTKDVLNPYFANADFMEKGFGFCAIHQDRIVGFAASNFPIRDRVLEIFIKVEESTEYRQKGLGITLAATLIEYCLEHEIEPFWDAANQISAHIAEKLGYVVDRKWEMFRTLSKAG